MKKDNIQDNQQSIDSCIDPNERYNTQIKQYVELINRFDTEDFGTIPSVELSGFYNKPLYSPVKGEHPRLLFTSDDKERIINGFSKKENKVAFSKYESLILQDTSGSFMAGTDSTNINFDVLSIIEAKAFRYAITGEELYGYQAIYAVKNSILTIDVVKGYSDPYRYYGHVMFVAACVYDWCYDLLSDVDKQQLINGCVTLMTKFEIGFPPSKAGGVTGHNFECQLLNNILAFAISVYDEYPQIYEYAAGRLFDEYAESQNIIYASGMQHEGNYYGPFRMGFTMKAQVLMSVMSHGKCALFDKESLHSVCDTYIDMIAPDGYTFRIGDSELKVSVKGADYTSMFFWASTYFGDPNMKSLYLDAYSSSDSLLSHYSGVSSVWFLIFNDPDLKPKPAYEGRGLINVGRFPLTKIFARSDWNDKQAFAIYMTMPEMFLTSHDHMECGSFQIYYKGMLVSDSGYYDGYGTKHHNWYSRQTISSNSLLIYNTDMPEELAFIDGKYSGGQSLDPGRCRRYVPTSIRDALDSLQCVSLGKASKEVDGKYFYTYLAADMTKAYDEVTVDEVSRYMISVATGDADYPMVFATFDRITAKKAEYKKTSLLHALVRPEVTDEGFVIISNTEDDNRGKLISQSLITDMKTTVYGGNGEEYSVNGEYCTPNGYNASMPEYRIESTPVNASLTDQFLTVMYVTDSYNSSEPIKAKEIETDDVAGAVIFNQVMIFPKNEKKIDWTIRFNTDNAQQLDYYIVGITSGKWSVSVNGSLIKTATVIDNEGILTFTAPAGSVEIAPVR